MFSEEAFQFFHQAITAFSNNNISSAIEQCQKALDLHSENKVFAAALKYLQRLKQEGKQGVYVTGEAFGAFIRGGGNQKLYEFTSAALNKIYQENSPLHLLDIGVGDGLALLPALHPHVDFVTLIEPSVSMLGTTVAALTQSDVKHKAFYGGVEAFIQKHSEFKADMAQATFSLQSLPKNVRLEVFKWLHKAVKKLVLVEFDVPHFKALLHPEKLRFVLERYEQGLNEYQGDLVAQGFLMPVFFGYFDATAARTNYEQPIEEWIEELKQAGFKVAGQKKIYEYWWSNAYLIEAN